jgi:UDP-N-acetylmuramyl pentapeptide phosphotransferase/UDP-N-acetylglucosamine-1-phosphate transferase
MNELSMIKVFLAVGIVLISFLLTYLIRRIAIRHEVIDVPNERSSHDIPTPRGGGLAIVSVWYIFLIFWRILNKIDDVLFLALLPGLLIVLVGFADDLKSLSPKLRFIAQLVASILGIYFLGGLKQIDLGFISVHLHWSANLIVVFAMLWMINLFNFLDGSDGYLASEGTFVFASLFIFTGNFPALAFTACILGFLFWNWPRAKIFCGDVGSTLIGYTVMIYAIYFQNSNQLSILIPFILTGLFSIDATVTLIRRFLRKERLSEAHKKHAYQRLIQSGLSHKEVVGLGFGVNLVLLALAGLAQKFSSYVTVFFVLQIIVVFIFMKYSDTRKAFS